MIVYMCFKNDGRKSEEGSQCLRLICGLGGWLVGVFRFVDPLPLNDDDEFLSQRCRRLLPKAVGSNLWDKRSRDA